MYKRLICTLFFVLVLLFLIAIIYIIVSHKPREPLQFKEAPSISIYLDDLHDKSRIRISQGADKTVVIDRVERGLSYIGEKVKRKLLLFVCNASFPNQWKYNGFGSLQGTVSYRRDWPDSQKKSDHYSTVIELSEISEYITGYYECGGFKSTDPKNQVYVFAPDKNNNTFIIKYDEEIEVEMNKPITIPCPVSDPSVNISLMRLVMPHKLGVISRVDLQNENAFDPKIGFRFKNIMKIEKGVAHGWGSYICRDEVINQFSAITHVVKPLETIARYSIDTLKDRHGNGSSIRIMCSSSEEVYLDIYNFASKKRIKVKYPNNDTHTVLVRIKTADFTNKSIVECITSSSYRILYSWKFREHGVLINGSSDLIIEYDPMSRNFSCCSKSNQSPKLKLLSCFTEAECQFKLNELKSNSYKNRELIRNLTKATNESCTELNVKQFPQGLLQCSLDKYTKQIPYYIDSESGQRRKKAPPPDGKDFIMRLEQKSTKRVVGGKKMRFLCSGPRFFIAQGFKWKLKKHDGSSDNLPSSGDENTLKNLQERLEITLKDQQVSEVHCLAPAIGSPSQSISISAVVNYTIFSSNEDF